MTATALVSDESGSREPVVHVGVPDRHESVDLVIGGLGVITLSLIDDALRYDGHYGELGAAISR